ncbi:MAG: hypothetical protein ACYDFT_03860 [Thermoplasmata archaeon]
MPESLENAPMDEPTTNRMEEIDEAYLKDLRLGQDIRFVLVCVGGGAARVGHDIIARKVRYLESVVINSDPRVQELEEFDRRVCLGAPQEPGRDTGGSPVVGGHLARAAEPALERVFEGATFVTVIASLGGGTGTGVLPFVLEAAARQSAVLSVFAIRPFRCEGERRALADRALGRLHFVDAWVEKLEHQLATLTVLDNERLAEEAERLPMNRMNRHWADMVATHIEKAFVIPAEAAVEAGRLATLAESEPATVHPEPELTMPPAAGAVPPQLPLMPAGFSGAGGFGPNPSDTELTFEIIPSGGTGLDLM